MYDTGGEVDALMNRCVRRTGAALDHQDDQHIEDDRPDRKIVAPAKDLEQEPLPLPTEQSAGNAWRQLQVGRPGTGR